ncbi:hypothetical protein PV08_02711 [Exophiala spinifera]|uniref:AMP-dependent synthetase/ligase domain-containing protein n=1 Tax=Exophiala spinifera TaxID=91928 RepID=A0A0D2BHI9_9EURO|nr:uncharacterized protein PV08_02711 [Exophiala spinifera]KIW18423.1 hypothetical protein PV08_02711 [Exophiala spinifera]
MAPVYSNLTVHLRPDRSITQFMLENVCNTEPTKVICEDTLTTKQITYGGIRKDAFLVANMLRTEYGICVGDVVSIVSRSCVDYILATHAVWAAGGTVSTINHSNTDDELAFAIKIIKPKIIIADATVKTKLDKALKIINGTSQGTLVMTLLSRCQGHALKDKSGADSALQFPDDLLRSSVRVSPEAYVLDGQDAHQRCAAIVLSSGTTGLPKAVMLSHHNLIAICEMLRFHNQDNWRGDMREVFFPYRTFTASMHVLDQSPQKYRRLTVAIVGFQLLHSRRATLARLVPTIALALSESPIVSKYRYPDLEYFSCAGAVLKPNVASKLREKFPGVSLCQTYGCTETSSCISQSGVSDIDAPLVATGTLVANMAIRFVDENLVDVSPGVPGEICVSCPTIMMGYKDNPRATQESFLEGGWYRTGDIGYLDDKEYLIIVDRIKDVIKYKGFQVSPTELEDLILPHPSVQDVGVTSTWDESEATEIPRAFVVTHSDVPETEYPRVAREIEHLVATQAAGYKRLRGGVKFVKSLPRNPTGKLLRRELRKQHSDQMSEIGNTGMLKAKI